MVIITRNTELDKIKKSRGWKLVYGRRKTGKSFLIERFTNWDKYFFVKRGGEVFDVSTRKGLNYDAFITLLEELLDSDKKVVVDEFHRLSDDFLDFLHINSNKGDLTLISSTLWLSKRLLKKDSPILGLFSEIPIGLIDESNILRELRSYGKPEDVVLLATYMREPLMLRYLEKKTQPIDIIARYFDGTKLLVPLLISSIFQEEDKDFTQIYEGVVRALANGKVISKEITDFLFSRNLIPKAEHGYSQQYLHNLIELGVVTKTQVYGGRRAIYSNASPLIDSYFYMDEKYNFSEQEMSEKQVKVIIQELAPRHVEAFIRNFLAKTWGLTSSRISSSSLEVDIALHRFKKLDVVGEVKWKRTISSQEIRKIEEKLARFDCRKILVVPKKDALDVEPREIEVICAADLVKLAQKGE